MSQWIGLAVICLAGWGIAELVMRLCRFVAMAVRKRKRKTMLKPFFEVTTPFSQLQYIVTNASDAENALNAAYIAAPTTHEGLPYFSQSVEKLDTSSFIVTMKYRRMPHDGNEGGGA